MTINIEIAGAPDLAALAAVHQSCFDAGWNAEAFAEMLAIRGTVALLAPDGKGFALVRALAGEAEILTLAVAPEARRKGYARALVRALLGWAAEQGAEAVFLEVRADNSAALALYEGEGFRVTGRRKGYYRSANGGYEDAVVMRRHKLD